MNQPFKQATQGDLTGRIKVQRNMLGQFFVQVQCCLVEQDTTDLSRRVVGVAYRPATQDDLPVLQQINPNFK